MSYPPELSIFTKDTTFEVASKSARSTRNRKRSIVFASKCGYLAYKSVYLVFGIHWSHFGVVIQMSLYPQQELQKAQNYLLKPPFTSGFQERLGTGKRVLFPIFQNVLDNVLPISFICSLKYFASAHQELLFSTNTNPQKLVKLFPCSPFLAMFSKISRGPCYLDLWLWGLSYNNFKTKTITLISA